MSEKILRIQDYAYRARPKEDNIKEQAKELLSRMTPLEIANLLWEMGENKDDKSDTYGDLDFNEKRAYQVRYELNSVYG